MLLWRRNMVLLFGIYNSNGTQPLRCSHFLNTEQLFADYEIPEKFQAKVINCLLPSVLWHCWLGGRKGIRPLNNWVVGCGMVICVGRDADK